MEPPRLNTNNLKLSLTALLLALETACQIPIVSNNAPGASASPTPTATASTAPTVNPNGPRAIRIQFKQTYPSGSFDASPAAGTPAVPGSGQKATRYFNPDGSLMTGAGSGSGTWLSSFELGISGSANASATNPNCAKFADTTESTSVSNCTFSTASGATPVGCGAPSGLYRVSEFDCVASTLTLVDGNGGPSDGIYLRALFDRTQLGSGENILATLEYVASSFDPPPTSPTQCFVGGVPAPEQCSDLTWRAYIKHSTGELVQPFFMLVPPTQSFVNTGLGTSGVSPQMRQFVVPLSGDPGISVLQLSRVHSALDTSKAVGICASSTNPKATSPANSPLCAGIVLYALTFYRI